MGVNQKLYLMTCVDVNRGVYEQWVYYPDYPEGEYENEKPVKFRKELYDTGFRFVCDMNDNIKAGHVIFESENAIDDPIDCDAKIELKDINQSFVITNLGLNIIYYTTPSIRDNIILRMFINYT